MTDTSKGTAPNFSRNRSGVGKVVDFRHLSRHMSETVQDRVQVAIDHYMCTRFRLVPKSMTVDDL